MSRPLKEWAKAAEVPTIAKGQQAVRYEELLATTGGDRLRVRIVSDAYRFQCSASVERWDGDRWREVWTLQPALMATPEGLAYTPTPPTAVKFTEDRRTLLRHARVVLKQEHETAEGGIVDAL